ncbi:MAG: M23 family metallopeptidase [Clostridiales bacterium]|nr:M23 family metallopeptidase [Clostridiales bacterium]
MKFFMKRKRFITCLILCAIALSAILGLRASLQQDIDYIQTSANDTEQKKYIKWVSFNVPYEVLDQALTYDINSYEKKVKLNWIELLACAAAKNGGNFAAKRSSELDHLVKRLNNGEKLSDITQKLTYYPYFLEAYTAVLGGFVGEYTVKKKSPDDEHKVISEKRYGLKVFSPIARGYSFSHYDDFGDSRSYGYRRRHLGNDLMGNIGTPIIAIESGVVEALGWNRYGGWRIGIRSFDGLRYYYYAHLRKNHPFNSNLKLGSIVSAGDVIGYLGMTGYSTKENVNNITTPHLHFGMQLVFDESQKESVSEIWINVYNIVRLLQKNRSKVIKDPKTKEYNRAIEIK